VKIFKTPIEAVHILAEATDVLNEALVRLEGENKS